ncbi:MinD/ParA family ATP-binding protein [Kitasatospora azatica]|uniref:MinD/ParA family ATP-binding protein n=1 Tax=Kitasatospora azatica TaxID=58347 RepID=UPI000B06DDF1|nr:hypothetical protein [Kitasatospora azatica]
MTDGVVAVVQRVGSAELRSGGWPGPAPDYAPEVWPEPLPLAMRMPLDPLGTVLIPPAARAVLTPRPTTELTVITAVPNAAPIPNAVPIPNAAPVHDNAPERPVPRPDPALGRSAALELTAERLVRQRPARGRRFSFGGAQQEQARLVERIRTPLQTAHRIAVLGHAAGTGRTVTTLALGTLLATHRPDRVIALDLADGALGARAGRETELGLGELVAGLPAASYQDLRRFTSRGGSGLEVLAGSPVGEDGYRRALDAVSSQYPVVLSDTGTSDAAARAALASADQLVICTNASVRGAAGAEGLMAWLASEGHAALVAGSVMVVSPTPQGGRALPAERLATHFDTRCRGVVVIPTDGHLAAGGEVEVDRLRARTRSAQLELAALVGDGMAGRHPALG